MLAIVNWCGVMMGVVVRGELELRACRANIRPNTRPKREAMYEAAEVKSVKLLLLIRAAAAAAL